MKQYIQSLFMAKSGAGDSTPVVTVMPIPVKEKKELLPILVKNMGHYDPPRQTSPLHASDVTKVDFCARRIRLMEEYNLTPKPQWISAALKSTFDMGKDVQCRVTDEWLGEKVWGHWKCTHCNEDTYHHFKPKLCGFCGLKEFTYKELVFYDEVRNMSGSIDCFMDLGDNKFTVIELKIINPEEFKTIAAPYLEHRMRTKLYLEIIKHSQGDTKDLIDLTHAKILYVSRGHGKKNENIGQVVPFKEFDIEYPQTEPDVWNYMELAHNLEYSRSTGNMGQAAKLCPNSSCDFAKTCPVRSLCWMGSGEQA